MEKNNKKRSIKWRLINKRLLKHHIPLFIVTAATVGASYWSIKSDDMIWNISMSTAYPALALLAATLLTGPWKVLNNLPNPVSDDLTRDIGIWAGITGLIHVVFGLQVHMRGKMWLLFFNEEFRFPWIRLDLFGTANYTGLIATCILLVLLFISNNRSLRALGADKWKQVQRSNYVLFLLVIVHSIIYMNLENRVLAFIIIFAITVLLVLSMQMRGFVYRKSTI